MFGSKSTPKQQRAEDRALLVLLTISQLFVDARSRIASEPTDELEQMAHQLDHAEAYAAAKMAAQSKSPTKDIDMRSSDWDDTTATPATEIAVEPGGKARFAGALTKVGSSDRVQRLTGSARTKAAVTKVQGAIANAQISYEKSQNAMAKTQAMKASAHTLIASTQIRLAEQWSSSMHPGNPGWDSLSAEVRVTWWYRRFAPAAAVVAASPALAGRVGVKSQVGELIGAASEAVLISAIAWEAGVVDPVRHAQLSAKLLLKRHVSEAELTALVERARTRVQELRAEPFDGVTGLPVRVASVKLVWDGAKELTDMEPLLKNRPRGNLLARTVSNLPGVGAAGAYVAELGGLRKTMKRTVEEFA